MAHRRAPNQLPQPLETTFWVPPSQVLRALRPVELSSLFIHPTSSCRRWLELEDKLTDTAMDSVSLKELMAQASPEMAPRQAPRFPTILLAAMEDMVLSADTPLFMRVLSWWLLVQSWGTLRFDDHRGLLPRDFKVSETGLLAKLRRSKVSGPDKRLNFRVVVIHSSAYVQYNNWLSVGWELLRKDAPHERDYLLPAPYNNFRVFKTKELKYATAFAFQSQVISLASYRGLRIFQGNTGHYYTPHSGRNFYAFWYCSSGIQQSQPRCSWRLVSRGSERHTRTAKFKIAQMQSAIAATFINPDSDQLAEAGDIDDLSDFLRTWEVPESSILRTKKILCSRTFSYLERIISLEPSTVDSELAAGEIVLDDIDEELAMKKIQAKQKQQSGNRERSELLGWDHKQARGRSDPISVMVTMDPLWEEGFSCPPLSATCCLVLIICLLPLVVLRFRIRVPTTLFASGVQSRLTSRTFLDLLGQTLLHQAMIDVQYEPPQCVEYG